MAKKQDKNKGLMSQDFLGDINDMVNQPADGGLYEKLARFERQKALQPLADEAVFSAGLKPITDRINEAEDMIKANMTAYIAANPDIDDSLLFDGTSDIVTGTMKQNSDEYRKLSRQIAFLDPSSAKYETIVKKMNKINSTTAQFRDDNKKLLDIRNLIKDENRINNISTGDTAFNKAMYDDILEGTNKDRFQNIDGSLHYVLNGKKVAIKDINASGPTMENGLAFESANIIREKVLSAKILNRQNLMYHINTEFNKEGVGNSGIKSLIFDGLNTAGVDASKNGAMYNTASWWDEIYNNLNIQNDTAAQQELFEAVRENGVTYVLELKDGTRTTVKDSFVNWFGDKLVDTHKAMLEELAKQQGLEITEDDETKGDESGETNPLVTELTNKESKLNLKEEGGFNPLSIKFRRYLRENAATIAGLPLFENLNTAKSSWNKAEDGTWSVNLLEPGGTSTKRILGVTEESVLEVKKENPSFSDEEALLVAAANKAKKKVDNPEYKQDLIPGLNPEYRQDLIPGLNPELQKELKAYGNGTREQLNKAKNDIEKGVATKLIEDWYNQTIKEMGGGFNS